MTFTIAAFYYTAASIISFYLMLLAFSQVVAFSELKFARLKNPIVVCRDLNKLVLPEYLAHVSLALLFLYSGRWHMFLLNLPLVVYNFFRYKHHPFLPGLGLYQWTTIMEPRNLNYAFMEWICKLVFYLLAIFCYLFDWVLANY